MQRKTLAKTHPIGTWVTSEHWITVHKQRRMVLRLWCVLDGHQPSEPVSEEWRGYDRPFIIALAADLNQRRASFEEGTAICQQRSQEQMRQALEALSRSLSGKR